MRAEGVENKQREEHRLEKGRLEKGRLEKERLERLEKERLEMAQLDRKRLEEDMRLEKARLEKECLKEIRLEKARLEKECHEKISKAKARLEQERAEQERAEQERAEQERAEQERAEQERAEQERAEQERAEQERAEQERAEQEQAERKQLDKKRGCRAPCALVKIFTTHFTLNFANRLRELVKDLGSNSVIYERKITREDMTANLNEIYFIMNFQHKINDLDREIMAHLPKNRYILYQLEQLNTYDKQKFRKISMIEKLVTRSLATFDYSQINIPYYTQKGSSTSGRVSYLPLLMGSTETVKAKYEKEYDVLFYGSLNARRRLILNQLSHNLDIKVVTNTFGSELTKLIQKSKVIINIHHYSNAVMETARLHEALHHDVRIVSEAVSDEEESLMKSYNGLVNFVAPIKYNMENISNLLEAIQIALEEWEADHSDLKWTKWKERRARLSQLYNKTYATNKAVLHDTLFFF